MPGTPSSWSSTPQRSEYDAIVVGAGPNGLGAAISLAGEGLSVLVVERAEEPGGATRTAELTLPGFKHDLGSAIHPMALASPLFQQLQFDDLGLTWCQPDVAVAHPLDGGNAAALLPSMEHTASLLGNDARAYQKMFGFIDELGDKFFRDLLQPPLRFPSQPLAFARFGLSGMLPATELAKLRFRTPEARALFAGNAAHSVTPLTSSFSSAIGIVLMAAAHRYGWPFPKGGAERIWRALVSRLGSLGGEVVCGINVTHLDELPNAKAILFDTAPSAMADIARSELSPAYLRRLSGFKHGPGAYKIDLALSDPIPWEADICRSAGTVHVGGNIDEVTAAEAAPWKGEVGSPPFLLVAQPSVKDPTRAPEGRHTAWAYTHVPNGFTGDATEAIKSQIERFAPGFCDCILAEHVSTPAALEQWNPNLIGGDIAGGANTPSQLFGRPILKLDPYATSNKDLYLCSASTPPGGGVHGMCGYWAAQSALKRSFR